MVRVKCDASHKTVHLNGTIVFAGEERPDDGDSTMYDIDNLPQYLQHKPSRVVCDLGAERKVLLSAGTDSEHERNNNATISINSSSDQVGRIFFAEVGYDYQIVFLPADVVSVTGCTWLDFKATEKDCKTDQFGTRYVSTSTNTASFDCLKVTTVAGHLICDDPRLAEYDRAIAAAYRDALGHAADKASVARKQTLWRSVEKRPLRIGQAATLPGRSGNSEGMHES